jgi:exosortase
MGNMHAGISLAERKPEGAATNTGVLSVAKILCISVLALLIYMESLKTLAADWASDPGASFGALIPPMATYAAWLLRQRIRTRTVEPDSRGLAIVLAGCLMFLIGRLGAEFFLTRVSFLVVLAGLTWTFWGPRRLRCLAFPFILLLTAIPLPALIYNKIALPLQLFASATAAHVIRAFGGAVYRDGNIIELPGISIGVAEACSGLNSLSSLLVAALLVGFLRCRRPVTKALLVIMSVPLAIGVNVLRIAGTAVMAVYWQDLAIGFYHSFAGWLVFVVSFAALAAVSRLLCWGLE